MKNPLPVSSEDESFVRDLLLPLRAIDLSEEELGAIRENLKSRMQHDEVTSATT